MKFNRKNVTISPKAQIGKNVRIGDNVVIYENVIIEDETTICNDCVLGEPQNAYYTDPQYSNPTLTIGRASLIRSHTIIYAGSSFGPYFQTGHRVSIREHTVMGEHCSVGTLSDIQGYMECGNYCRLHSNVHVGQRSNLGNFVFIYPYVVLTNDPTPPSNVCLGPKVGDYSQIATGSILLPGVVIGQHCLVGAGAIVSKDVDDYSLVAGNPAKRLCDVREIRSRETDGSHYPWVYHFDRGMPWEGVGYAKWRTNQGGDDE